jgi:hypothetical protein
MAVDHAEPTAKSKDDINDQLLDNAYDGLSPLDNPYSHDRDTYMADLQEKVQCQKSLFHSQETPPAAFTQDQPVPKPLFLSPNTLRTTATTALAGEPAVKTKKLRKRVKKGGPSASQQPAPEVIRVQDRIPLGGQSYHIAGEPILPPEMLKCIKGDLRQLHDLVLSIEKHLISLPDPTYPLFMAKVYPGLGFVEKVPGDMFFLRFEHIFDMFHLKPLDVSLVCLFALHLSFLISREKISKIAVADPYYMCEGYLRDHESRRVATEYIEEFMVANKHKKIILLPYFPR